MKINKVIFISVFSILFISFGYSFAQEAENITVRSSESNIEINHKVLGTSILGWEIDHGRKFKDNYAVGGDYGYGIWDAKWQEFNKEPLQLIKNIKVKSIRLIGQFTGWEKGIGKYDKRKYKFGLDEQIKFCKMINAEPIICLQNLDLTGSYEGLIRYLIIKYPFIKYIEIGNESWDILSAENYAKSYLFYYDLLKRVNPNLELGVVGKDEIWDRKVIRLIGDKFDFIVKHYYPYGGRNNNAIQDSNKIFEGLFVKTSNEQFNIQKTHALMKEIIGKVKPIAVTEFTAWFVQENPVPYRHCLGTALINAELIKIFMKPENNIMFANYWNFINEYWGMIANGFNGTYKTLNDPYYKRPNYYIFEMYAKHFGDVLISADVNSDVYEAQGRKIAYLSVNASKSADGKKVYLMVVNKNMNVSTIATIDLKDFMPAVKGNVWVLNGPSVDATNEVNHDNVKVTQHEFEIKSKPFEFTFEPHSLTAIEIERAK